MNSSPSHIFSQPLRFSYVLCPIWSILCRIAHGLALILMNFIAQQCLAFIFVFTGKSLSEALIFATTNPQYDDRLYIELRVQYMKITSSKHVLYINCFLFLFWHSEQFRDNLLIKLNSLQTRAKTKYWWNQKRLKRYLELLLITKTIYSSN